MCQVIETTKEKIKCAILDILDLHSEKILSVERTRLPYKGDVAKINGIALEIYPEHGNLYLELIPEDVKWSDMNGHADCDYSLGDMLSGKEAIADSQIEAMRYISDLIYNCTEDYSHLDSNQVLNLIYIGAAEALLDQDVSVTLSRLKIPAKVVENSLQQSFGYMVYDRNCLVKLNYCEFILLNKYTQHSAHF